MKCPQCKLVEMSISRVENNKATHKCRKCGKEVSEDIPEDTLEEVNNVEESE